MMDGQKFCLKWDGFQSNVTSVFDSLRQVEELVDVTLCCEGHQVRAHRMMLSACSPYFRDLLKNNPCQQMVFFLKDTSAVDLNAVIEFIYKGSVNVSQSQLASFIKTAEMLQIRGLSGDEDKTAPPPPSPRRPAPAATTPPHKRRRMSGSGSAGRRSPASPGQRPHSPTSAPPGGMEERPLEHTLPDQPVPPPPPPPQSQQHHQPQQHPQQHVQPQPETVKVEKIDLTEEEDEASLDSTLCHVAEYEGVYDTTDGASGMEQMPLLSAAELGGLPPLGAGPSQPPPRAPLGHPPAHPPPGAAAEDGSGAGGFACDICGRWYRNQRSLRQHRTVHAGMTTCPVCGKVSNRVADLRIHLQMVHRMSAEEVRQAVPSPAEQLRRTR